MSIKNPPKISVIVPVYNTAQYLPRCLDSLVNQTLADIEIIIINDGSVDQSQEIIDYYRQQYPDKIKAFYKKNGGVSSARNFGINEARGIYIGFVDSDDHVASSYFEDLYQVIVKDESDIACTNYQIITVSGNKLCETISKIKSNKYLSEPVVWNKIIKRSFFVEYQLFFTPDIIHEDFEFHYKICSLTNKIAIDSNFSYFYEKTNELSYTYNNKLDLYSLEIVCKNLLKWQKDMRITEDLFLYNLQRLLFFYIVNQPANDKNRESFDLFKPIFSYKTKYSKKLIFINRLLGLNFGLATAVLTFLYRVKNAVKKA